LKEEEEKEEETLFSCLENARKLLIKVSLAFCVGNVNFSKSQPNFSLTEFSAKFKCQTQFQHCFSICYSLVFQHILSGVSAYDSSLCFSIYYSLVFQHMLQLGVSAYATAWCFSI
jgi:hypothetical protein